MLLVAKARPNHVASRLAPGAFDGNVRSGCRFRKTRSTRRARIAWREPGNSEAHRRLTSQLSRPDDGALALRLEVADISQRLEARKIIDRAKGLLMTHQKMTEPEAFRWIQRTAMDRRTSMQAVAGAVLEGLSAKS